MKACDPHSSLETVEGELRYCYHLVKPGIALTLYTARYSAFPWNPYSDHAQTNATLHPKWDFINILLNEQINMNDTCDVTQIKFND